MTSKTTINVKNIKPISQLFHNEWIDVYPTKLHLKKIHHWPENLRTLLDFQILEAEEGKKINSIDIDNITEFLLSRYDLKISDLADSISMNGVRVPLIILDNGKLIDGNRRYFACHSLYMKAKKKQDDIPEVLKNIPVWVIKKKDIDKSREQKILAEANFVKDLKVAWTLDVKANVIHDYYQTGIKMDLHQEEIFKEIRNIYGITNQEISAYLDTVRLTREYIKTAPSNKKLVSKERVRKKFVYFWEFRNKAYRGRTALDEATELPKVKKLFFKMIDTERFNNIKQIEPLIRAVRDKENWTLLVKSKGTKISAVEAAYLEGKAIKSAEDKIRNFSRWLDNKADPDTFSKATFNLLEKLTLRIQRILKNK